MRPGARAILWVVLVGSCEDDGATGLELGPDFECRARPDDSSNYLQPICRYIADELRWYPEDPNTLAIEMVTPGDQVPDAMPPTNTAEYDHVYLSCCYTGDIAVMRRATREVVGFSLGDL